MCVCVCVCVHVCVCVCCATPWIVVYWALLSMGFSRQEYWSGLPYPPPKDLPDPGIKPVSFASPALAGGFFTTSATWEAHIAITFLLIVNILALLLSRPLPTFHTILIAIASCNLRVFNVFLCFMQLILNKGILLL